ncbi:RICIN domain-containing protein [Nonomuraea sp. NPDC049714]|uniref:RICIN domain-containing protein n=1 Tax=Nonomuraea sp. NPDC049714 TaxID=3364357 RepID=UPI00379E636E
MSAETRSILANTEVIAANQDWGGRQGHKISANGALEVWRKPMSDGSVAVVLLNRGTSASTVSTTASALGLGLGSAFSYSVRDLRAHTTSSSSGTISASVPGHGAAMYTVTGGGIVPAVAIRGAGSGRCLDVTGASPANGAQAQIWDCNGQPNQQWRLNADGTITGVPSGRCLDVPNNATADGTKLIIWSCNGGANQRWTRT